MAMTWTSLKADIAEYLKREDLTARIPNFIELAEFDIATNMKPNGFEALTTGTLTSSNPLLAHPTRFKAPITFTITATGGQVLKKRSYSYITHLNRNDDNTNTLPEFYADRTTNFYLFPTPDSNYAYELLYYERLAPLGAGNATNWLTDNHPNLLLFASLMQSAPYMKNDERLNTWQSLYSEAAKALMLEEARYKIDGMTT